MILGTARKTRIGLVSFHDFVVCDVVTEQLRYMEITPADPNLQVQRTEEAIVATKTPKIPLPKDWSKHIQTAIVHVVSLARIALTAAGGRVSQSSKQNVQLRTELSEAQQGIALLKEELRLKDLRMTKPR